MHCITKFCSLIVLVLTTQFVVAQDNGVAVGKIRDAIEKNYSHRDKLKIDWDARIKEYESKLTQAGSPIEFAKVAAEMLSVGKDLHLWLQVDKQMVPTYQANLKPNFNPRILPKLVPKLKQHGKTVLTGQFNDGVRYVVIATWDDRDPQAFGAAIQAIEEAIEAKAPIIIDVRANMGGNEMNARRVAGYFVKEKKEYAKHVTRSNGTDSEPATRTLDSHPDKLFHPGPCVVLMGGANVSSCESFLDMMRAAGATLIGEPTPGASGNPKPFDLGNGVVLFVPSWRNLTLDGAETEGVGMKPDVEVVVDLSRFQTEDPVLAKAREFIKNKK